MDHKPLISLLSWNFLYPLILGPKYSKIKAARSFNKPIEERVVHFANRYARNLPFYKRKKVSSISTFKQEYNVICKSDVMKDPKQVTNNIRALFSVNGTSGGTSGAPISMKFPLTRFVNELGFIHKIWYEHLGWNGQIRGVLRNGKVGAGKFKIKWLTKEVIFDGFESNDVQHRFIYDTLIAHNIKFLHAYPSSLYRFLLWFERSELTQFPLVGAMLGSEPVHPFQAALFDKFSKQGFKYVNWFGHSEKLVLAKDCPRSCNKMLVEEDYGLFEVLGDDNEPVKEGSVGEIVGSTVNNATFPLMRYKTGDYAKYCGRRCEACGHTGMIITDIQGRRDVSEIFLDNGGAVSITALNLHGEEYNHIAGMQYHQHHSGALDINIVPKTSCPANMLQALESHYSKTLSGKVMFQINYVEELRYESNGKFLPLIQDKKSRKPI